MCFSCLTYRLFRHPARWSRIYILGLLALSLTWAGWAISPACATEGNQLDIMIVLDNSGSMRKNDPNTYTKKIVTNFLKTLRSHDRLGLILFDEKVVLVEPLNAMDSQNKQQTILQGVQQVDYKGKFTNSPAAIEKAIYELQHHGRKNVRRVIIFLSDGIVDTGKPGQDQSATQWLKTSLAQEARENGIRIFGVAFTDSADYSLMQVLALKTNGAYYRALNIDEVKKVFQDIRQELTKPALQVVTSVSTTSTTLATVTTTTLSLAMSPGAAAHQAKAASAPAKRMPDKRQNWLLALALAAIILGLLGWILISLRAKRNRRVPTGASIQPTASEVNVPAAKLECIDSKTGEHTFDIKQALTVIGREFNGQDSVVIDKPTISSLHATLEYKKPFFYLEDQASTNGTYVNDQKLEPNSPQRLNNGDRVSFDDYTYRFMIRDQAVRGDTVVASALVIDGMEQYPATQDDDLNLPRIEEDDAEALDQAQAGAMGEASPFPATQPLEDQMLEAGEDRQAAAATMPDSQVEPEGELSGDGPEKGESPSEAGGDFTAGMAPKSTTPSGRPGGNGESADEEDDKPTQIMTTELGEGPEEIEETPGQEPEHESKTVFAPIEQSTGEASTVFFQALGGGVEETGATSMVKETCANHPHRPGVAHCSLCNKSLCQECLITHEGKSLCGHCYGITEF